MSHRLLRRVAPMMIPMLLVIGGCEVPGFRIEIPDFDTSQVLGMHVWHYDEALDDVEPVVELAFGEPFQDEAGRLLLPYTYDPGTGEPTELTASMARDPADPDRVTVRLPYVPLGAAGEYRISTYNAAGESPLTTGSYRFEPTAG